MFSDSWKDHSKLARRLLLASVLCVFLLNFGDGSFLRAAGSERFDKRFPTGISPRVILTNDNGTILVRGVPRNEVHIVAIKHSSNVEIDTETVGNRIRFDTHIFDPNMKMADRMVDYTLEVPEKTLLEVRNISGRITVDGVKGSVNVDALNSMIDLTGISGNMNLRSVSGNMSIERSSGRIEANSISGDLRFTDLECQSIDASTASGNIVYIGNFYDNGRYALSNYSGTIDVYTVPNSSFELDARSVKGSVVSELPLRSRPHYNFNPERMRQSLLGVYNDGAASVHLSSFSGRITIRKK